MAFTEGKLSILKWHVYKNRFLHLILNESNDVFVVYIKLKSFSKGAIKSEIPSNKILWGILSNPSEFLSLRLKGYFHFVQMWDTLYGMVGG